MKKIEFLNKIKDLLLAEALFKITFAKPRPSNKTYTNMYLKPVSIKGEMMYSIIQKSRTQELIQNYSQDKVIDQVTHIIDQDFFVAFIFTNKDEIQLIQNKKGHATVITRPNKNKINFDLEHDHQKERFIKEERPYLQALGLANSEGRILDKAQDKYRQIHKFIEVADHILKDWPANKPIHIADMGSGKGYLTFALYDHLTHTRHMHCRMTGYELREDLVTKCYTTALECGFMGLVFEQKSIDQIDLKQIDMVIALHACDIATDMAIAKGIHANATHMILSPCCHKQIRKDMNHENVLSPILRNGILEERQAELITDGIRALIMESRGYMARVFEFISPEHTGKNLMITATKDVINPSALAQVAAIKSMFGIKSHYLEEIL
jgi:hypothetical protein